MAEVLLSSRTYKDFGFSLPPQCSPSSVFSSMSSNTSASFKGNGFLSSRGICHNVPSKKLPRTAVKMQSSEPEWKTISPREGRVILEARSWHNKTGEIIRQLSEDVWVIERGYVFLDTFDVGGRTTLIKLPDGSLFVHSPLALTREMKQRIDEIGNVGVVVAPNTEHIDFIAQWKFFYPDACYLGPPGCIPRFPHIPFSRELARDNVPDPTLQHAPLSQFFIASVPFFNETLFVHQPTKTLLCTDFFWAYPTNADVPRPTLVWGWAMNNVYKPVHDRVLIQNQAEFRHLLQAVLDSGFQNIIPCHGDIIEVDGQTVIRKFFANKLS